APRNPCPGRPTGVPSARGPEPSPLRKRRGARPGQRLADLFKQRLISRRKPEPAQLVRADPAVVRDVKVPRFACDAAAKKRGKTDVAVGVGVFDPRQHPPHFPRQPDLLRKLAQQALVDGLARLELPARQLPEAAEDDLVRPARDEQPPPPRG